MSGPVVIGPRSGEIIGDAPDRRVELLSDAGPLHVTWSRFGPGRDGADLHVHHHHTDLFYVLEGELTARLGPEGRPEAVPSGKLIRVPPLVVHGFQNAGAGELSYLNLHAPGCDFAGYMRAMRDGRAFEFDQHPPPDDGGRPTGEVVIGHQDVLADDHRGRVAILAETAELSVVEARVPADAPAPAAHVHRRHVESLYVLEGEMVIRAGGRELPARAGTWVQFPAGVPHTFTCAGSEPARYLDLHAPDAGFAGHLRALLAGDGAAIETARRAFDQEPAPG